MTGLLSGLARPALVLSARDDPFVPLEMFEPYRSVAAIRFVHPARGGHCGYWQAARPHYWAAEAILDSFAGAREGRSA